jgi:4-phospho-D-threonate 3-dehydrogenase / 4-phospho-D-erythronate 3-dehydrogenase
MKPLFAITGGDPYGIGPEIVLKALVHHPEIYELCSPVVFGSPRNLHYVAQLLKLNIPVTVLPSLDRVTDTRNGIQCYEVQPAVVNPVFGRICAEGGQLAYNCMREAIAAALQKKIKAIVTAPLHKESLRLAQVPYLDHTEMLTQLTGSTQTMTLFVTGNLRIFFYSRHIRFADITGSLGINKLVSALQDCQRHLQQIGFESPRLALAALNPHAGDQGLFGREEIEILTPAVSKACRLGILVEGPVPADSVFHLAKEGKYDAVLSLYHDQGHIAAKTYDFKKTVALTLGLPFLRTSVDHGTAFDIAGRGIADETSMVEAIVAAHKYCW